MVRESESEKEIVEVDEDDVERLPVACEELCWAKATTARRRKRKIIRNEKEIARETRLLRRGTWLAAVEY